MKVSRAPTYTSLMYLYLQHRYFQHGMLCLIYVWFSNCVTFCEGLSHTYLYIIDHLFVCIICGHTAIYCWILPTLMNKFGLLLYNTKSLWFHLFNFPIAWKSNVFDFSPLCVFKYFPNCLPLRIQSHIGCICWRSTNIWFQTSNWGAKNGPNHHNPVQWWYFMSKNQLWRG